MITESEIKSGTNRLDDSNRTETAGSIDIMNTAVSELKEIIEAILTAEDSRHDVRYLLSSHNKKKKTNSLEAVAAIMEFQSESGMSILSGRESMRIASSFLPATKKKKPVRTAKTSITKRQSSNTEFIKENTHIPPVLRLTGIVTEVFRQTDNHDFAKSSLDHLITALKLIPRHKKTGLLTFSDENLDQETANFLFRPSLLFAQACHQIADLQHEFYQEGEADHWRYKAQQIEKYIRIYFWNKRMAMFRVCREAPVDLVDVHGSALAIYRKNATSGQLMSIARQFYNNYHILTDKGAIVEYLNNEVTESRSAAGGTGGSGKENFDLAAAGWFAYSLDFINPSLADEVISSAAREIAVKLNKQAAGTSVSVREDSLPALADIVAACRLVTAVYNMQERRRIKAARMA